MSDVHASETDYWKLKKNWVGTLDRSRSECELVVACEKKGRVYPN